MKKILEGYANKKSYEFEEINEGKMGGVEMAGGKLKPNLDGIISLNIKTTDGKIYRGSKAYLVMTAWTEDNKAIKINKSEW